MLTFSEKLYEKGETHSDSFCYQRKKKSMFQKLVIKVSLWYTAELNDSICVKMNHQKELMKNNITVEFLPLQMIHESNLREERKKQKNTE